MSGYAAFGSRTQLVPRRDGSMGAVECRSICTQRAPYVSTYTLTGSSARWARVVARGACRACPRHDVTEAWKSRRLVLRPPLLGTTVVRTLLGSCSTPQCGQGAAILGPPLWAVVPREWSTGCKVLAVRVGARAPGWRGRDEAAANRTPGRGPRSRIMVKEAGRGQRVRVEGERWAGA
jgi:hypothetical protein